MISDIMGIRSESEVRGSTESDLEFVSQYEKILTNGRDDENCDGLVEEEGEGKAIDRALKLLGLDGKRPTQSSFSSPGRSEGQGQSNSNSNSNSKSNSNSNNRNQSQRSSSS